MSFLANIAHAQSNANATVNELVGKITDAIVLPLVQFISFLAIVVFIWGLISFFKGGDDAAERAKGQQHMLWGVVGLFIMVSVYGIIRFVANTVGQGNSLGF